MKNEFSFLSRINELIIISCLVSGRMFAHLRFILRQALDERVTALTERALKLKCLDELSACGSKFLNKLCIKIRSFCHPELVSGSILRLNKSISLRVIKPPIQSLSKDEALWSKTLAFLKIVILLFLLQPSLQALSVGSNTVPSRQARIMFPNTDSNNTILGFAVFENGFTLSDATTTCTYNAFYPVSSIVKLNGGQLILNKDLWFGNTLIMYNGGWIFGNNQALVFPKSLLDLNLPTIYPATPSPVATRFLCDDVTLAFNSKTRFHIPVHFKGKCRIDGRGNFIYLDDAAEFIVRKDSSLVIENAFIRGIKGSKIRCLTDSGTITLRNSTLTFARDCTFTNGSLLFDGDVAITGTSVFTYGAALTSTISPRTKLFFDQGTSFNYAPRISRGDLIYMSDVSSVLYLKGCSLTSTRTGMVLSAGTLVVDDTVTMSSQGLNTGEAITLSSGLNVDMLGSGNLLLYGRIKYE